MLEQIEIRQHEALGTESFSYAKHKEVATALSGFKTTEEGQLQPG
jgi:hypothetical protein